MRNGALRNVVARQSTAQVGKTLKVVWVGVGPAGTIRQGARSPLLKEKLKRGTSNEASIACCRASVRRRRVFGPGAGHQDPSGPVSNDHDGQSDPRHEVGYKRSAAAYKGHG